MKKNSWKVTLRSNTSWICEVRLRQPLEAKQEEGTIKTIRTVTKEMIFRENCDKEFL